MSAWDDIVSGLKKATTDTGHFLGGDTLGRDFNQWSGDALHAVVPGGGGTTSGHGPGQFSGPTIVGNNAPPVQTPAETSANTATNNLLQQLSGLTYGQTQGTGAATLAKQLMTELQSLPAADAEKVLTQLSKDAPTVASDLNTDENPQASTSSDTNYGFDPLSLGKEFSTVMAPWLAQQQQLSQASQSSLASQMEGALKGASPAIQQAFSAGIPALEDANTNLSNAANMQLAEAPQWDAMVSALTNAVNQAKLTQAAAQNEPYVAAGAGTGTLPTTSPAAMSAQQTLNALQQKVLGTSG